MVVNLFDLKNMHETLCGLYSIKPDDLDKFLNICNSEEDVVSQFCDYFDFKLDMVDVTSSELLCKHITTTIDSGDSLRQNGFRSLKELLQKESVLTQFLKENYVILDIAKMTLKYKDFQEIQLLPERCEYDIQEVKRLSSTLNHDNGVIEAFYCGDMEEMLGYSTVAECPEILDKIDNVIYKKYGYEEGGLCQAWKNKVDKRLVVEFLIQVNNMDYCTAMYQNGMGQYDDYMQETYEYIDSYPQKALINRWFIQSMIKDMLENDVTHTCGFVGVRDSSLIKNIKLIAIGGIDNNG